MYKNVTNLQEARLISITGTSGDAIAECSGRRDGLPDQRQALDGLASRGSKLLHCAPRQKTSLSPQSASLKTRTSHHALPSLSVNRAGSQRDSWPAAEQIDAHPHDGWYRNLDKDPNDLEQAWIIGRFASEGAINEHADGTTGMARRWD